MTAKARRRDIQLWRFMRTSFDSDVEPRCRSIRGAGGRGGEVLLDVVQDAVGDVVQLGRELRLVGLGDGDAVGLDEGQVFAFGGQLEVGVELDGRVPAVGADERLGSLPRQKTLGIDVLPALLTYRVIMLQERVTDEDIVAIIDDVLIPLVST